MAQTLQSLYAIPTVVPQLALNNIFTGSNTFSGNLALQGVTRISQYSTPYVLTDPGGTTGNWYILGTVTFGSGNGSAARLEILGSQSYSTGSLIAGKDVIDLRMGNNTSASTAPDVMGNTYRIGDGGNSPFVNGSVKLVSVNLSVTDNQYQIWYQSNTFTRYSRVFFYSGDATFVFSGAYQSTGDPSNTVTSPNLYVYVVPRTVALNASVISTKGRLLVNTPTDDGTSALLVNGATTLAATTITGALNVGASSVFTTSGSEYDMFFRTASSVSTQVYLALGATNFAIAYCDASGNYLGQALAVARSNGAVSIPTTLTIPNSGFVLTLGGSSVAGATWMVINTAAGNNRGVAIQTGGNNRWVMYASNSAESGSNVGSDFQLLRYNDAGTQIDAPLTIARSTGLISISQYFSMSNGQTLASWAGGAFLTTGPGGGTITIGAPSGSNALSLNNGTLASSTAVWTCSAAGQVSQNGTLTVNTSGSSSSITINDTGGNGSNLKFTGTGTNPAKFIRAFNGSLAVLNNAYNNSIFTIDDSGNTYHAGEVQTGAANAFRAVGSSVGVFWRWDGNTYYLLKTAAGSPYANWDNARPFAYTPGTTNVSGSVSSDATWTFAAALTVNNAVYGQSFTLTGTSCTIYSDGGSSPDTVIRSGTGGTVYYAVFNPSGNAGGLGVSGTITAGNFVINSDQRLKTNDHLLDGKSMLKGIMDLEPRWYLKEGKPEFGFFAQHVKNKTQFKHAVSTRYDKHHHPDIADLHQLDIMQLVAPVVSATQQINRELQELKLKVETQAIRIAELESKQ